MKFLFKLVSVSIFMLGGFYCCSTICYGEETTFKSIMSQLENKPPSQWQVILNQQKMDLDDSFFKCCINIIDGQDQVASSHCLIIAEEAAVAADRADIMKRLIHSFDANRLRLLISLWNQANEVEKTNTEEATKIYIVLAKSLYRPNSCNYRLAEIACKKGNKEDAVHHFKAARAYDLQLEDDRI